MEPGAGVGSMKARFQFFAVRKRAPADLKLSARRDPVEIGSQPSPCYGEPGIRRQPPASGREIRDQPPAQRAYAPGGRSEKKVIRDESPAIPATDGAIDHRFAVSTFCRN